VGRSKPTFRNYVDRVEGDWQPYRRTLRRRDQPHFDRLFEHARGHADAAGQLDPADPRLAVLFSMVLAQQRELAELRGRVERLEGIEQRVDPGGTDPDDPDEPDEPVERDRRG
jgi:hypothetical protein